MSSEGDDSKMFLQMFCLCSEEQVDTERWHECASPATLVELMRGDRNAEYRSPPPLPGFAVFGTAPQEPAPCVRYVVVRRALSTGNYGEAMGQLQGVIESPSKKSCSHLLVLEAARLLWFVDEFDRALDTLANNDFQPLPFAYLRSRDLIGSCLIELFCLKSLGYPLSNNSELHAPSAAALDQIAVDLNQVCQAAETLGDLETATWAAFNAQLAKGLACGRLEKSTVLRLVARIPKNGNPHALRRAGLAFAHLRDLETATELLRNSHRLAEDLYPINLITLKAALNLGWLTYKGTTDAAKITLAANVLRIAIRRFVVSHAGLAQTSLAVAFNYISQYCFNETSDAAARSPSETEITEMLRRIPHDVMETVIAKSLAEKVIGPADILPVNTPWLDLVATGTDQNGRVLSYGIQVKSGGTTLLTKDIPGAHILDPHRGFIAIAVKRLGHQAAVDLKKLEKGGITVLNWTGANLANIILQHPSIVALVYRHSLGLDHDRI